MNLEILEAGYEKLSEIGVKYASGQELWRTAIEDIELIGNTSFRIKLVRPSSGRARGGYIYLFRNSMKPENLILREEWMGKDSGWSKQIEAGLEIRRGTYIVAYGPTFTVDVNVPATTVTLINGNAFDFQGSVASPISQVIHRVESFYQIARQALGYDGHNAGIILSEGGVFAEGRRVQSLRINKSQPSGVMTFRDLKLQSGKTYNVWIWLWNTNRPIAGYSFTLPK